MKFSLGHLYSFLRSKQTSILFCINDMKWILWEILIWNDIVLIFLTTWLSLGVKAKTLKTIDDLASGVCVVMCFLTWLSSSKSLLCWDTSFSGGFSRLQHRSHVTRPTTNMPMSGMNTRMPFPASAPRTLQRDKHTVINVRYTITPYSQTVLQWSPCLTPLLEPEADMSDRSKNRGVFW